MPLNAERKNDANFYNSRFTFFIQAALFSSLLSPASRSGDGTSRELGREQHQQQRLLRMQPIFRLIEHDRRG
jgi:hypothetical protein